MDKGPLDSFGRMHDRSYRFSKNQVAFIHLPKSGGTTVWRTLYPALNSSLVNPNLHRPISIHCNPSDYKYFIWIRDPRERAWSYYHMQKRLLDDTWHRFSYNFEVFMDSVWEVNNVLTRYLSANSDNLSEVNDGHFDLAFQNLQKMLFVGLFEILEYDLKRLYKLLTGNELYEVSHLMQQSEYDRNIPKDYLSLIEDKNVYDIKLYDCVKLEALRSR